MLIEPNTETIQRGLWLVEYEAGAKRCREIRREMRQYGSEVENVACRLRAEKAPGEVELYGVFKGYFEQFSLAYDLKGQVQEFYRIQARLKELGKLLGQLGFCSDFAEDY